MDFSAFRGQADLARVQRTLCGLVYLLTVDHECHGVALGDDLVGIPLPGGFLQGLGLLEMRELAVDVVGERISPACIA